MAEKIKLTKEGYDKLVDELELSIKVKRKEVADKLKEARSYGDLSENAEYDAAKEAQANLEERIAYLEETIKNSEVVEKTARNRVDIGSLVKVEYIDRAGKTSTAEYKIVGSAEADPLHGKLSVQSPVGRGLMGSKKGDTVEIQLSERVVKYTILDLKRK